MIFNGSLDLPPRLVPSSRRRAPSRTWHCATNWSFCSDPYPDPGSLAGTGSSASSCRACGRGGAPVSSSFSPPPSSPGTARASTCTGAGSPGPTQRLDAAIHQLTRRMALENPTLGRRRIQAEVRTPRIRRRRTHGRQVHAPTFAAALGNLAPLSDRPCPRHRPCRATPLPERRPRVGVHEHSAGSCTRGLECSPIR